MIKEAFLVCALSLPLASANKGYNNPFTRESFLKEYKWIHDLLEGMYPGHEFLIIPHRISHQTPVGWFEIPFQWRGHNLYRRPLQSA
jgi:hypothetical protein